MTRTAPAGGRHRARPPALALSVDGALAAARVMLASGWARFLGRGTPTGAHHVMLEAAGKMAEDGPLVVAVQKALTTRVAVLAWTECHH